jgi:ribose/xylose/arabinose/galactoside ABC-type transport system permease subunit
MRLKSKINLSDYILEVVLVCLIIIIASLTPGFFTKSNLLNVLRNASLTGIIAFGMTITIIAGQIDLSVGSSVALYCVVAAKITELLASSGIMPPESGVVVGMGVMLVISLLLGSMMAAIHIWLKIPTFIITLAFMNISYGLAAILSNGFPITVFPSWYNNIGAGRLWGIPIPAIVLLIVFFIVFIIMKYTRTGREIYAVGGGEEAARLCGINIAKVKIVSLVAPQVLAAISSVLVSSQVMSASSQFGKGYEMTAVSAVIIGGASMSGGIGKVWGTFLGIIFLGIISNGMTILNINEFMQYVVRGALILIAVIANTILVNKQHST